MSWIRRRRPKHLSSPIDQSSSSSKRHLPCRHNLHSSAANNVPGSEDLASEVRHRSSDDSAQSFLHFGCIDIPFIEGMEFAPTCDEDMRCSSLSLIVWNMCVEIAIFAAPRSGGLWEKSFDTLRDDARQKGYATFGLMGKWGKELLVRPKQSHSGDLSYRFVGIEGSRWLMRLIYSGMGAENDAEREKLNTLIDRCVVHRGSQPMPPGELLYMTLPDQIQEYLRDRHLDETRHSEAQGE